MLKYKIEEKKKKNGFIHALLYKLIVNLPCAFTGYRERKKCINNNAHQQQWHIECKCVSFNRPIKIKLLMKNPLPYQITQTDFVSLYVMRAIPIRKKHFTINRYLLLLLTILNATLTRE